MPKAARSDKSNQDTMEDVRHLDKGDQVFFPDGSSATVTAKKVLGEGGQGTVYQVEYEGDLFALKWIDEPKYFKSRKSHYYQNIKNLSENKSIERDFKKIFALPIKVTEVDDNGQFGYLMEIIDKRRMTPLERILSSSKDRRDFELFDVELTACINLARAFNRLHSYDLVFTDLNEGSIFFNTETGDVKICDCDNIVSPKDPPVKIGQMGFMAPEVFGGKTQCTDKSDDYSLAVIFFRLLFRQDPFEGSRFKGEITDDATKRKMYIDEPIFICSENNTENLPPERIKERWEQLPKAYRQPFIDTFVDGLFNKKMRTLSSTWVGIFDGWMDSIQTDPMRVLPMDPIPPRTQIVLFIIDISKSMNGRKMTDVNNAIRRCHQKLREIEREQDKPIVFKIGLIVFGKSCGWHEGKSLVGVDDFKFEDIEAKDFNTRFNRVCMFLNETMETNILFNPEEVYKRPFMLLITDGRQPRELYLDHLTQLRTNKFYRKSQRYAIGVDDEASRDMLIDFTEDEDNILSVNADLDGKLDDLITNLTIIWSDTPDDPEAAKLTEDDRSKMKKEDR